VIGWKEFEMESCATKDNCIIVCSIETSTPWHTYGRLDHVRPRRP